MRRRICVSGEADLARLDAPEAQRVLNRLRWLAENFDAIRPEALTGHLQGLFKLRAGDYRVIYSYEQESVSLSFTMSDIAAKCTKADETGAQFKD